MKNLIILILCYSSIIYAIELEIIGQPHRQPMGFDPFRDIANIIMGNSIANLDDLVKHNHDQRDGSLTTVETTISGNMKKEVRRTQGPGYERIEITETGLGGPMESGTIMIVGGPQSRKNIGVNRPRKVANPFSLFEGISLII